jgi:hypothetical protein
MKKLVVFIETVEYYAPPPLPNLEWFAMPLLILLSSEYQGIQNLPTLQGYIFRILQYSATNLQYGTMLVFNTSFLD